MAMSDYALCDNCGGKAFYDSNLTDPGYLRMIGVEDDPHEYGPIDMAVLCSDCAKTHKCVVVPKEASVAELNTGK